MIIIGIALALGLLFVAAMPQRCMRQRKATRFEFALLVLMMVTVTPLSFGYFFSWLMLPFAAVTPRVLDGKGAILLWWSVPALTLLARVLPFPREAQLYGNTCFATLLLFVGFSIELLHCNERQHKQGQE